MLSVCFFCPRLAADRLLAAALLLLAGLLTGFLVLLTRLVLLLLVVHLERKIAVETAFRRSELNKVDVSISAKLNCHLAASLRV